MKKANAQQRRQPLPPRKKLANSFTALAALCAAVIGAGPQTARAVVIPPRASAAPAAVAAPKATADPNATVLALDSSLFFVLDGTISSRAQEGSVIRAHLRDPIMLGGLTIAPAGSLVGIHLTHTQGAQIGNVDGYVDIYFDSLALASGQVLPLVTPTSHIDPHVTAGQNSTQTIADVTGDIFVPGYFLFSVLRKGLNVNLGPGTVIRARTAAALHLANGTVAIETPPPFPAPADTPYANFVPAPLVTPPGFSKPTPKPSPSPTPTATPTAQPT